MMTTILKMLKYLYLWQKLSFTNCLYVLFTILSTVAKSNNHYNIMLNRCKFKIILTPRELYNIPTWNDSNISLVVLLHGKLSRILQVKTMKDSSSVPQLGNSWSPNACRICGCSFPSVEYCWCCFGIDSFSLNLLLH